MPRRLGLALCLTGPLVLAAITGSAAEDRPLSPAQIALFESNQLKSIASPTRIRYRFQHEEAGSVSVTDQIVLDIREIRDDGKKNVWVDFLSGERHVGYPPAMGFDGNPLLMYALERDVNEMHRLTGGAAVYFRNRIRNAFVDGAKTQPVSITVGGQSVAATRISIVPFRGDQHLVPFGGLGDKEYEFVLSEAIPGTIYAIRTETPASGNAPSVAETITYTGEER